MVGELEELVSVGTAGTASSLGRTGRPIWASFSAQRLSAPALASLAAVPAAWEGILDYVSLLVQESTHLHLVEAENAGGRGRAESGSLDEAVEVLVDELTVRLERRPERWRERLLSWSTEVLGAVSSRNAGRRATATCSVSQLLQLYLSVPSLRAVAELLRVCLRGLFASEPQKCIAALFVATSFGTHFDWALAYIGNCFPSSIVADLLRLGVEDWLAYVKGQTDGYDSKLRPLAAILSHVGVLRAKELRDQLAAMAEAGLSDAATEEQQRSLLFAFKLASSRMDLLHLLLPSLPPFRESLLGLV